MRLSQSFPGSAIVYGVAPWVGWNESTAVGCVLIVYAHSPVPIVLAGKYFSRSAGRLRSTTRSDEKSELEKKWKSLKNETSPNCHRTFVWCPRGRAQAWRPKTRPNGSLRLSPWPLARLPVGFRDTLGALRSMKNPSLEKLKIMIILIFMNPPQNIPMMSPRALAAGNTT